MNRFLFSVISIMGLCGLGTAQSVESPDGFVVWTEGDRCYGELKYQKLEKGKGPVGEKKTAVNKGVGADIMVVISFDGKWIAFSRFIGTPRGKYNGPCDYHSFDSLDVYIARIDGGLPAKPIKIAHGYWPSWGDDSQEAAKTLYFTNYSSQTIQKTTIEPDGFFSPPKTHATCLKAMKGTRAHTQGSPNGKYIAYRPNAAIKVTDIAANKDIPFAGGGGCHPCWGPRSQYLIWAKNRVCLVKKGLGKGLGSAGFGNYYYGISNEAEFDQGTLWAIGSIESGGSNSARKIIFKPIDISNDGWKPDFTGITVSSKGSWCDIHVGTVPASIGQKPELHNEFVFKPLISPGTKGLQLVIEPHGLEAYAAGLYNMQGKQKVFINIAGPSRNHMPLSGIADGMYMIKLSTARGSVQKAIHIAR